MDYYSYTATLVMVGVVAIGMLFAVAGWLADRAK